MQQQIFQIADTVHGSIQISYLEKQVISTQPFNRLHNILQNSTVYLTFPSNQTKRFAHSLGVMHLGGKMFLNAIINADDEVRCDFLHSVNLLIDEYKKSQEFSSLLRAFLGDQYVDLIDRYKEIRINEPLYNLSLPGVVKEEHQFAFTLVYQSVRLAALLHDVGHPPFSHISEYALKDVWKSVYQKSNKGEQLTQREETFLEATSFYAEDGDAELHEQIGNKIAQRLIESVISKPTNIEEANIQLFYSLVTRLVNSILCEENKLCTDIHRLIAASIDCDRLDYITRDMLSSGFNVGKIEYDRLISSFKLVKQAEDFLFCTDVRTISTVEDYFHRRWQLYKNIIFHHRVVKTDYLLGEVITSLAKDYLGKSEIDSDVFEQALPLDISGLWRAIKEVRSNNSYFNALIQWDDSWLISVLRQQYFAKYIRESDSIVRYQMEELLSNRKNYRSMIKKMEAFSEIDKIVLEFFSTNYNEVNELLLQIERLVGTSWSLIEKIREQIKAFSEADWLNKAPTFGFLLTRIRETLDTLYPKQSVFEQIIIGAVQGVSKQSYGIRDSIVVFKRTKTGLEKNFPSVHKDNDVVLLDKVSRVKTDLRMYQTGFPTFFIYLFESDKKVPHKEFLNKVGEEIGIQIVKELREKMPTSAIT
ncbi:HD domain-containing protein [Brevibacillus sp. Leaf182]|uniref:HD domain-containing protein n=1 Tax=Brevibacillus sp. Leaf182 TaxID=1736290 RepID=UPI0006FD42FC|nr:HD domain-containing protein [Brevibacillus sp. Leaf182]